MSNVKRAANGTHLYIPPQKTLEFYKDLSNTYDQVRNACYIYLIKHSEHQ